MNFVIWDSQVESWHFTGLSIWKPGQIGRHFPDDVFKFIFLYEYWCFYSNLTAICSQKASLWEVMVGSDNGLSQNKRQVIIEAKCVPSLLTHICTCASLGHDVLIRYRATHKNPSYIYTLDDVLTWKWFPRFWTFVRGIHCSMCISLKNGK